MLLTAWSSAHNDMKLKAPRALFLGLDGLSDDPEIRQKLNGEHYMFSNEIPMMGRVLPHKMPTAPVPERFDLLAMGGNLCPKAPQPPAKLENKVISWLANQLEREDFSPHADFMDRSGKDNLLHKMSNSHEARVNFLRDWLDRTEAFLSASRIWLAEADRHDPKKGVQTLTIINTGHGATINANQVLAENIENSFNVLNKSKSLPPEVSEATASLLKTIAEVSAMGATAGVSDDIAQDLGEDAQELSREVTKEKPKKSRIMSVLQKIGSSAKAIGENAKPITAAIADLVPVIRVFTG